MQKVARCAEYENIDRVVVHPIKNPEWIANDRSYTNLSALRDARSNWGRMANAVDNISNRRPMASAIVGLALAV
jgi:hypothetical protein